jgi:hypothetical protein
MKQKAPLPTTVFLMTSAMVLCITALAKFYSVTGTAQILQHSDPLLHVNNRTLMILAGLLEVGVASYLFRSCRIEKHFKGAAALLWLSGNFLAYRLGRYVLGVKLCPCLGALTEKLPISPDLVDRLLGALVVFWFVGSFFILRTTAAPAAPLASGPDGVLPAGVVG